MTPVLVEKPTAVAATASADREGDVSMPSAVAGGAPGAGESDEVYQGELAGSAWVPPRWAYAVAVGTTGATLVLCAVIEGQIGFTNGLVLFVPSIILSAACGGLGPGLLATLISALGAGYSLFPLPVAGELHMGFGGLCWGALVAGGVMISLLTERLHRARCRAEQAGNESARAQEQLSRIVGMAPGVVFTWRLRPDGSVDMPVVIPRLAGVLGMTARELAANPWAALRIVEAADVERLRESVVLAMRSGAAWQGEFRVHHPKRGECWIEGRAAPQRQANGDIVWYGFLHDIGGRKQAEAALRESEGLFSTVFRCSPVGIVICDDATGRIIDGNATFQDIVGYTHYELIGHSAEELRLWCDPQSRARMMQQVHEEGRVQNLEVQMRRKSGETADILLSVEVIELGHSRCLLGLLYDLAERKRTEAALHDRNEIYGAIVGQAKDAIVLVDAQTLRFVEFNASACAGLGYSREEFACLSLADIDGAPTPLGLSVRIAEAGRTGGVDLESVQRRKDGTLREVSFSARPVKFHGRDYLSVVWSDISERTRAEEALQRLSGQILHLQDQERRRVARELHDTTAQELAALCMNLAVLRHRLSGADAKTRELLASTAALADHCGAGIRTLSYLLHPPLLDELGLAGAVRDCVDGFAKRSGIRADLDLSPSLGRLSGEIELALFRVLQESLANVHRHSGSKVASVRLIRSAGEIRLEVQDAGHGFPVRRREPREAGHIGVGIAGMRERLRQLGGRLEIDSGSTGTTVRAVLAVPNGGDTP